MNLYPFALGDLGLISNQLLVYYFSWIFGRLEVISKVYFLVHLGPRQFHYRSILCKLCLAHFKVNFRAHLKCILGLLQIHFFGKRIYYIVSRLFEKTWIKSLEAQISVKCKWVFLGVTSKCHLPNCSNLRPRFNDLETCY